MDFRLEAKHRATLRRISDYLNKLSERGEIDLESLAQSHGGRFGDYGPAERAFIRRLGTDGWLGLATPREYGGQGLSFVEQWLFHEELMFRRLPTGSMLTQAVIPSLTLFASEELKAKFLPRCLSGEVLMAIGYSEPGAGTDLAALSTRAAPVAGGYRLNGHKTWCSHAHTATHIWLAARTGTPESRHKGISMFIVPADLKGITIRPIITQLNERTNDVFFDDVFLPEEMRLGEENEGWKYITGQLNFERVFCHAEMLYEHYRLVDWWRKQEGVSEGEREFQRRELAKLAADIHVSRLMAMRAAWMMDSGFTGSQLEASISKIINTETHQRLGIEAFKLMGSQGQLAHRDPEALAGGRPARAYLSTPAVKFGGGTNELQRDLIAGFGLGLPRTR
ncbi:acyl-CoA dehydrogenase family protein [Sphingobium sp. V4]|uniref:acyl-CoA dehydrogenase family protein n=1 Tax=Sphingobium sp. V4 TaxID=3038927 RepID=UPI0025580439|nr:acyl-CoA dehydrogenase family protein [Sphingobium sp. V4]WIW89483.1 acyl-CoA dehydrogenase family protein [Sphingobium sp. V4]